MGARFSINPHNNHDLEEGYYIKYATSVWVNPILIENLRNIFKEKCFTITIAGRLTLNFSKKAVGCLFGKHFLLRELTEDSNVPGMIELLSVLNDFYKKHIDCEGLHIASYCQTQTMFDTFQEIELTFEKEGIPVPKHLYTRKYAKQMNFIFPLVSCIKNKRQLNITTVPIIWRFLFDIQARDINALIFFMITSLKR